MTGYVSLKQLDKGKDNVWIRVVEITRDTFRWNNMIKAMMKTG